MSEEGVYCRNTTEPSDVGAKLFVRADTWYFHDSSKCLYKTPHRFYGNPDLSLVAPIILGRFLYD